MTKHPCWELAASQGFEDWDLGARFAGPLPIGMVALVLALAVIALGAVWRRRRGRERCLVRRLGSTLPTAGDLGLDERRESEWDNRNGPPCDGLIIPAGTDPSELGAAIEDAGFQGAVGRELGGPGLNVRFSAAQFDSEEGALEARDILHEQDLKSPCAEACVVTPLEYELDDVPDSAAVHHVPTEGDLPPGESRIEAHHAEFVIGPRLYVVQVDGKPSSTFSADFDKLMQTVYGSASSAE